MAGYFRKIPYKQDMPPPGGFGPIEFKRNLPKRGPSGTTLFLIGGAVMMYGFYNVRVGNRKRRELKKETIEAKNAILPLLQAEQDRFVLKRLKNNLIKEAEIMKDVKGWNVGESVYNTKRWVPPIQYQLEEL